MPIKPHWPSEKKSNDNHDAQGRFTSADGGASDVGASNAGIDHADQAGVDSGMAYDAQTASSKAGEASKTAVNSYTHSKAADAHRAAASAHEKAGLKLGGMSQAGTAFHAKAAALHSAAVTSHTNAARSK
jgi:hypothetical protein